MMKTGLGLLIKLGLASVLIGSQFSAIAKPQVVSTLDAQLISYFRPYAPAAEVLIRRSDKNSSGTTNTVEKARSIQKRVGNNKPLADVKVCSENTASKTIGADGLDDKPLSTPELP